MYLIRRLGRYEVCENRKVYLLYVGQEAEAWSTSDEALLYGDYYLGAKEEPRALFIYLQGLKRETTREIRIQLYQRVLDLLKIERWSAYLEDIWTLKSVELLSYMIGYYAQEQDWASADALLQRAEQLHLSPLSYLYGRYYQDRGQMETCLAYYQRAVEEDQDIESVLRLGQLYQDQGRREEALSLYRRFDTHLPVIRRLLIWTNAPQYGERLMAANDSRDDSLLIDHLFVQGNRELMNYYLQRQGSGHKYHQIGRRMANPAEALFYYQQAIKLGYWLAYREIANFYEEEGQLEDAEQIYRQWVQLEPKREPLLLRFYVDWPSISGLRYCKERCLHSAWRIASHLHEAIDSEADYHNVYFASFGLSTTQFGPHYGGSTQLHFSRLLFVRHLFLTTLKVGTYFQKYDNRDIREIITQYLVPS